MRITDSARVADAIEKLEDLDRALAPEAHRIAEPRCVHCTMLTMTGTEDRRELCNRVMIVVQVAHNLVHIAVAYELPQHGAHSLLALVHLGGQIAHPGRIDAPGQDLGSEFVRERPICLRERDLMVRQMQPGAAGEEPPLLL